MKELINTVEKLMNLSEVQEITLKKVEDSKVEIYEGEKYAGRYQVQFGSTRGETVKGAIMSMKELQAKAIGLFKINYPGSSFELVLDKDGDLLHTATVGSLGGISETHIPADRGVYKEFGEGKTLADMVNNPFALDEFCKSFNK